MSTNDLVLEAATTDDGSPFAAIDPDARIGTTIADPGSSLVVATSVSFENVERGTRVAGILHRPADAPVDAALPAVVVQGPMLSIKEQTASLYAQRIAALGYVTLTFDYSYFGESTGQPRQLEDPAAKASDISSAVTFLHGLPGVQSDRIAALGICGSGGYVPWAASKDARISAVVSVVPFTAVEALRGIPQLVDLEQARKDREAWEAGTAEPTYMILLPEGENEGAEYYFEAERGAHDRWSNGAVSWSAETWLGYDPNQAVASFGNRPLMVVTAEKAYTLDQAKALHSAASGPAVLHVVERARHFDMYDLEPYVSETVGQVEGFLAEHL
ncbi:MAG: alpha/beta hydrolase [Cellulomonadaceae bacterium]|nr:alpha/beta hydrolase [Cellulomonadaceae bacterium]